ncbi:CopG family transcriptional regulator [Roseovarius sp. TE539]|uniref:type II toxin-antitoxin system BrnA family antitoxin n=1 Tax=Roseovarius sp. TE539 TaxID=2249812 RepID=UPI000DE15C44|nr:CopG family transcriptional regulator [Roseovarius sp. TE539]RBI69015.1 CopG family transcriptional regulator [Roseovarius sp. TE539]
MKATDFDERFDAGEDISAEVDWAKARRLNVEAKRVTVDFPSWGIDELDRQAQKLGVTRQALIRMWIAERLAG